MSTPYDRVAYPTAVFAQTHPERLAVLARIMGLDPVLPARARILEIGGGNCMNLLAIAAAYPQCHAEGFDLSTTAIAYGQALAVDAGLDNVTLVVEDIVAAHLRYPAQSFDYVIVHGVYAWVPEAVRTATMALVGHVLSERGVAFVSYNCMPGGHLRMIMRELLMVAIDGVDGPDERIAEARSFLEAFARPLPGDETFKTLLREQAGSMLDRPDAVLFHDELGDCFAPQHQGAVIAAGARNGLRFLTDGGRNRHLDGFVKDEEALGPDPDAQVVRAAVEDDYTVLRFFRQTLFVRAAQQPDRRIDPARLAGLYLSCKLQRDDQGRFHLGEDVIEVPDAQLGEALDRAAAVYPQHLPIADIATNPEQLRTVLQLFTEWYVNLHVGPVPFPPVPGPRPTTGRLIRAMLHRGERMICRLDHALLHIDQPELRALLMAADGTRTMAELAAADHGIPPDEASPALTAACRHALLEA